MSSFNMNQSKHVTWLLLIICIVLAAFVFIPGFDYRFPPYHNDEGLFLQELLASKNIIYESRLDAYPPGLLFVYQVSYLVADFFSPEPVLEMNFYRIVQNIRLVSALLNIATTAVIFLTAKRLSNHWVAFVAALGWCMMPYISYKTLAAISEPWMILCFTLTLYCLVRALQEEKPLWATLAVVFALVAVIFKYSAFIILGMGVGISCLQIFLQWPSQELRWRWLRALFVQLGLIVACALMLFFGYGAGASANNVTPAHFLDGGLWRLFDFPKALELFEVATTRLGIILPIFLGVVLIGGFLYLRAAHSWQRIAFIFAIGGWFLNVYFIVSYLIYELSMIKYTLPPTGIAVIVFALSLYQILFWLTTRLKQATWTPLLYLLIASVWIAPRAYDQWSMMIQRVLPNSFIILQDWANTTISESGTVFIDDIRYYRVFGETPDHQIPWLYHGVVSENPRIIDHWMIFELYGGYTGKVIPWITFTAFGDFHEQTAEEWRERYVNYVLLDEDQTNALSLPESRISMDDLLLLRHFPSQDIPLDAFTGTPIAIYRIGRMQHELNSVLDANIHLVGYDLNTDNFRQGGSLRFTPYWRADESPTKNYQMYLHLVGLESRDVLAQADGIPSRATRPTSTWSLSEELIIGSEFTLNIPDNLPSGSYRILAGLYDLETGQRLLAENGEDYIMITTVELPE